MTALSDEILALAPPAEAVMERYTSGYVDGVVDAAELVAERARRQAPDPGIATAATFRQLWNFDLGHIGVEESAAGVQLRIYSRMHQRWFELPLAACCDELPPPLETDDAN